MQKAEENLKESCLVIPRKPDGFSVKEPELGKDVCIFVHHTKPEDVREKRVVSTAKRVMSRVWETVDGVVRKAKRGMNWVSSTVGVVRKVQRVMSRLFSAGETIDEEKLYQDRKSMSIFSGIILAANCTAITSLPSSLENMDESVRQAILIPAALSFMTTLFLIVAPMALPTFDFTRVRKIVILPAIFTACSYSAYVAMKLSPISKGTVIAMAFSATYMFSIAVVFITSIIRVKCPQVVHTNSSILPR